MTAIRKHFKDFLAVICLILAACAVSAFHWFGGSAG